MSSPATDRDSTQALPRIAQRLKRERDATAGHATELSVQIDLLELCRP
jgi:hypothetical protein